MHNCPDFFANVYDFNNAKLTKCFSMLLDRFTEPPVVGNGFPEAVYQEALELEFQARAFSMSGSYRSAIAESG